VPCFVALERCHPQAIQKRRKESRSRSGLVYAYPSIVYPYRRSRRGCIQYYKQAYFIRCTQIESKTLPELQGIPIK
jgi:hypothetical protein